MSLNLEKPPHNFIYLISSLIDHSLGKLSTDMFNGLLYRMIPNDVPLWITFTDDFLSITLSNIGKGSNLYYGETWCDCNNWRIVKRGIRSRT